MCKHFARRSLLHLSSSAQRPVLGRGVSTYAHPAFKKHVAELDALAEAGQVEKTRALYESFKESGMIPQELRVRRMVSNIVLKAHANSGDFQKAQEWIETMAQDGITLNEKGLGKLLEAAAKASCVEHAEMLVEKGIDSFKPDIEKWSMLMDAYAKLGLVKEALRAAEKMQNMGIQPNIIAYNTLINACAKGGRPSEAQTLLDKMVGKKLKPDLVTYGSVLDSFARRGAAKEACEMLKVMEVVTVVPDVFAWSSAINACAKAADRQPSWSYEAQKLLESMQTKQLQPDRHCIGSVVEAFARASNIDLAKKWLAEYEAKPAFGTDEVVVPFTAVLRALASSTETQQAMDWFQAMQSQCIQPTDVTYASLLTSFAKAGRPQDALRYLAEMAQSDLNISTMHCNQVIHAFAQCQDPAAALRFVQDMFADGIPPDVISFLHVMSACRDSPADVLETVLLFMVKTCGVSPNSKIDAGMRRMLGARYDELKRELAFEVDDRGDSIARANKNRSYLARRRENMLPQQDGTPSRVYSADMAQKPWRSLRQGRKLDE